jgi:hypothetical protein
MDGYATYQELQDSFGKPSPKPVEMSPFAEKSIRVYFCARVNLSAPRSELEDR